MDSEKGLMNGKFIFKTMPDGSRQNQSYCRCEPSFPLENVMSETLPVRKHTSNIEPRLRPLAASRQQKRPGQLNHTQTFIS